MISFLEGKTEHIGVNFAIINTGGIGYRVTVLPKLLSSISNSKDSVKMFIHSRLNMREGTFDLYGFDKKADMDLFSMLISVSGIGPKNAMGIMSSVPAADLKEAVVREDAGYLKKISGLGPKTAQRLVLELKNKIDFLDVGDGKAMDIGQQGDAMEALLALGYTQSEAMGALKESGTHATLQAQIRAALQTLGKK